MQIHIGCFLLRNCSLEFKAYGLYSKGQFLNPTGNSTHQQEKDRECFYTLCPLFLTSTDLIKDNKREAERLPYDTTQKIRFLLFYRLKCNIVCYLVKLLDLVLSLLADRLHFLDLLGSKGVKIAILELVLVHTVKHEGVIDVYGNDVVVQLADDLVRAAGEQLKNGTEIVGNHTKVKVVKNKVAPPFRTAEFDIVYGEGISKWGELVDLAVQMDIVQKSGSWFSMGDERIGQGANSVKEYLINNPEIAESVEAQVRENLWKLNGGAPKAPAKAAEKAVAISADDFDDED